MYLLLIFGLFLMMLISLASAFMYTIRLILSLLGVIFKKLNDLIKAIGDR